MEFLKEALGDDLYTQVAAKLKGNDKIKLANLADGGYVGKDKFDTSEATITDLRKQLSDRDKDIAALKKSTGDNEELSKQLTDLQSKYDTETKQLQSKIQQTALGAALDLGVTKAKGKNAKAIKALLDTSKLSLKEDGTVEGLDTALEALKQSDSYLFEQVETKPEGTGFQSGGLNPDTPEAKAVADAFAAARGTF